MSLSQSTIIGKVISNPESRFTNSDDPVTRLLVQTGNGAEVKIVCYRVLAEKANNLKDGDLVMAVGSLITSTSQPTEGMSKKSFELNARDLYKISGSIENVNPYIASESRLNQKQASVGSPSNLNNQQNKEEDLSGVLLEEEIPF
ncbi:MAG: single-stranded DNA-binding protein [Candidatus Caenarcaniphilales bacterium]|nr:single-stranded DNA-binding protein [Candidatus Caenarcaniphilales bacterium]